MKYSTRADSNDSGTGCYWRLVTVNQWHKGARVSWKNVDVDAHFSDAIINTA